MNAVKEAFSHVKNDINEIKGQIVKLIDRVNSLAEEVQKLKKKK
jgi:uncharacterized protein YoxC